MGTGKGNGAGASWYLEGFQSLGAGPLGDSSGNGIHQPGQRGAPLELWEDSGSGDIDEDD